MFKKINLLRYFKFGFIHWVFKRKRIPVLCSSTIVDFSLRCSTPEASRFQHKAWLAPGVTEFKSKRRKRPAYLWKENIGWMTSTENIHRILAMMFPIKTEIPWHPRFQSSLQIASLCDDFSTVRESLFHHHHLPLATMRQNPLKLSSRPEQECSLPENISSKGTAQNMNESALKWKMINITIDNNITKH